MEGAAKVGVFPVWYDNDTGEVTKITPGTDFSTLLTAGERSGTGLGMHIGTKDIALKRRQLCLIKDLRSLI